MKKPPSLNNNHEVEKTMNALEGIQGVSPQPFFYTRLQAKLEKQTIKNTSTQVSFIPSHFFKPSFVFGFLAILLGFNFVSMVWYSRQINQEEVSATSNTFQEFVSEYSSLNQSTYFVE